MSNQRPEDIDYRLRRAHRRAVLHRAGDRPPACPSTAATPRTALALLESEMLLDGDPAKNLATFVTTFMEPEAVEVIATEPASQLHRPRRVPAHRRDLQALRADAPPPLPRRRRADGPGTACAGSSEAVMLGALAMKWRWKARERPGKPDDRPNLVYGADVHVVWDKFCRYFDVEPRQVPCRAGATRSGPTSSSRTSTRTRSAWSPSSGRPSPATATTSPGSTQLLQHLAGRGLDVPLHIDAASGGFVFPFSDPDFAWDFRLPSVKSINVSGHKFGLVYPGVGWLVFRDDEPAARGPRLLRGLPRRARRDVHAELLGQLVVHPRPVLQLRPPRPGRLRRRSCARWTPTRRRSPTTCAAWTRWS